MTKKDRFCPHLFAALALLIAGLLAPARAEAKEPAGSPPPPRFAINAFTYDLAEKWLIFKYHLQYGSDAQYAKAFRCLMTYSIENLHRPYSEIVTIRTSVGLPKELREAADEADAQAEAAARFSLSGNSRGVIDSIRRALQPAPDAYREPDLVLEFDMGSQQSTEVFSWSDPAWRALPESLVTRGVPAPALDLYVGACALYAGLSVLPPRTGSAPATGGAAGGCGSSGTSGQNHY